MKYLTYLSALVILALLLFSFTSKEKHRKPNLPAKGTFGHIQFIQEVNYHAIMDSGGSIIKGDVISDTDDEKMGGRRNDMPGARMMPEPPIETWTYNEYGDEIENAKYHANGKLCSRVTHIYYENGDIKEVIDSSFPVHKAKPAVHIQQYTYSYDTKGNQLVSNKWDYNAESRNNASFTRTVNTYDSAENLRAVANFDADTINPTDVIWSTYNAKGKVVESDERIKKGDTPGLVPFERNDFWYDGKGRLYDKATYHPHMGLVKDEKIKFDSNGKTVDIYSYGLNRALTGTVEKRTFNDTHTVQEDTYDANGNLTDYTISHFDSSKHLLDKGVFHINSYRPDSRYMSAPNAQNKPDDTVMVHHLMNDDHYNPIVDDNFSNDGKTLGQRSFQYNYDSTGNWIGRVRFNKDKPVKITEREIGYFRD